MRASWRKRLNQDIELPYTAVPALDLRRTESVLLVVVRGPSIFPCPSEDRD